VCRREGVADFPNPFRGTAREDDWARAFAGEAVKTAPEPLAQAAPISFAAMTKAEIVGQVRAQRGVDLNPSLTKAELIAAISFLKDPEACLICNGYKDEEFIDLGLYAKKMGDHSNI